MLAPIIKSLILEGFRSLPRTRVELENPTFFVGRNGSGKSNLVDGLAFLAEAMASPLDAVFERRGGSHSVLFRSQGATSPGVLGLGVILGPLDDQAPEGRYACEIRMAPRHGFEVLREQCGSTVHGSTWSSSRVGETVTRSSASGPPSSPTARCGPWRC